MARTAVDSWLREPGGVPRFISNRASWDMFVLISLIACGKRLISAPNTPGCRQGTMDETIAPIYISRAKGARHWATVGCLPVLPRAVALRPVLGEETRHRNLRRFFSTDVWSGVDAIYSLCSDPLHRISYSIYSSGNSRAKFREKVKDQAGRQAGTRTAAA